MSPVAITTAGRSGGESNSSGNLGSTPGSSTAVPSRWLLCDSGANESKLHPLGQQSRGNVAASASLSRSPWLANAREAPGPSLASGSLLTT